MTEREINEKISAWVGKECSCDGEYWGDCAMHHLGGLPTPYVTSDRCAVELLPVLVDSGIRFTLGYDINQKRYYMTLFGVGSPGGAGVMLSMRPTISEAISVAVVAAIDSI